MDQTPPKRESFFLPDNLHPPAVGAFWRRYAIMGVLVVSWMAVMQAWPLWCHWDVDRGTVSAFGIARTWGGGAVTDENAAAFNEFLNLVKRSAEGIICLVFIAAIVCAYGWRRIRESVAASSWKKTAVYALAGAAVFILADYVFELVRAYSGDPGLQKKPALAMTLVQFAAVGIIGPVAEELAVRLALYQFMRTKLNFVATALISSVAFGLMHFGYPDPMKMVMGALGGLVLAWSYERTGSILTPIAIHALNNCWMQAMRAL